MQHVREIEDAMRCEMTWRERYDSQNALRNCTLRCKAALLKMHCSANCIEPKHSRCSVGHYHAQPAETSGVFLSVSVDPSLGNLCRRGHLCNFLTQKAESEESRCGNSWRMETQLRNVIPWLGEVVGTVFSHKNYFGAHKVWYNC